MRKLRRLFAGGSANEQLTAILAALLLPLLAVDGVTLLRIRSLLNVHAFVGMLLIPVVAAKPASTGWRMVRYYRRSEEYVREGPPQLALRVLVAPMVVASTVFVFGTGVALLALDQTHGTLVGLHKASLVVWAGAFGYPRHMTERLYRFGRVWPSLARGVTQRAFGEESATRLGRALAARDRTQRYVEIFSVMRGAEIDRLVPDATANASELARAAVQRWLQPDAVAIG